MLWAVAFLGRLMSDAQVVFGFSLFIFGKSVRWFKKDHHLDDNLVRASRMAQRVSTQFVQLISLHTGG